MSHILIGWELGAARGHIERMLRVHDALLAAGHSVDFALQRLDGVAAEHRAIPGRVWQAPLWPRLLASTARIHARPPASLADILMRLGLGEPGGLASLVGGWEAMLAASRPDVVIAEYAPALLLATRGRVPALALGGGFDTPPADMARFPSLTGAAVSDEAPLVAHVNAELAGIGRPAVAAMPAIFACERPFALGIAELDPYRQWRTIPMVPPLVELPLPPVAPPQGDEVFVYWGEKTPRSVALWRGLERSGLTVRLHVPRLHPHHAGELTGRGFLVEPRPLPFGRISGRSRLLVSHGGNGFVTTAMLHGRPQVAVHFDLEKRNNGLAIDALDVGAQMPLGDFDPDAFAAGLRTLHADDALAARALANAHMLRARFAVPTVELIARAVGELGR